MTTVNFGVSVANPYNAAVPTLTGTIDGNFGNIGAYTATGITPGGILPNSIIFCVQPDVEASGPSAAYNVFSGVNGTALGGLSANQVHALEVVFSDYFSGSLGTVGSVDAQAQVMVADWTVVKSPALLSASNAGGGTVTATDITNGEAVGNAALVGGTVNPNLQFLSLQSVNGTQDFLDVSATPIPASLGLFLTALVVLAGFSMRKKLAAQTAA